MKANIKWDIVVDVLVMVFMKRRPKAKVVIHSDQGSQYGSDDWDRFCRNNNLKISMSRRGNFHIDLFPKWNMSSIQPSTG